MTAVTGCVRTHPKALDPVEPSAEPIVLEIQNHNWSDVDIDVLHDSRRDRLATVTAAKDLNVEIPRRFQGETGTFRLILHRLGSRDSYTTEPISIRTGYTVRLTIESDLQRSSVGVW